MILVRVVYIWFSRYCHGKVEMQLGTYLCPRVAAGNAGFVVKPETLTRDAGSTL